MKIRDVAALAGVSPSTVSNALNRPERVAGETRRRVLAAVAQTGYVPNASASRLRSLQNRVMGILSLDVTNAYHGALAKGAQDAAEAEGFVAMLCDCDASLERAHRHIEFLSSQHVAGVLACGSSLPGVADLLDELSSRGIAVVLLDETATGADQCSVVVDDFRGGELVAQHLLDVGRRNIAFIHTDLRFAPFAARWAGLQKGASSHPHGAAAELRQEHVPLATIHGEETALDRIDLAGTDAVFCMNDNLAFVVLRNLLDRGIRVPDDIALIGYDDRELASLTVVPLSSVRQPAREVGATAARLLVDECDNDEHTHQHVLFQPELVARTSTTG